MKREIKFKFIYGIDGKEETYFAKVFTFGEIENRCHLDILCDNQLYKYSILGKCQYTGLKDKNGKEIYERDIVGLLVDAEFSEGYCLVPEFNDPFEVKFEEGRFVCYFQDERMNLEEYWNEGELTILGNIYENPELLKEGA